MKRILTAFLASILLLTLFSACAVVSYDAPNGIEHVYIVSSSENYRRDEKIPSTPETKLTAKLAKAEGESLQFILNFPRDVSEVQVTLSALTHENGSDKLSDVSVYKEHYLYCEADYNKERPKGYYPDALIPIDGNLQINNSVDIKAGENQGYWITVKSSETQLPGLYTGEVTVRLKDGKPIEIPVEIEVWDFAIPVKPSFETAYDPYPLSSAKYAMAMDPSVEYLPFFNEVCDLMYEYRVSGGYLPIDYAQPMEKRAQDMAKYLKEHPQVTSFNIGSFYNPPSKDYADSLEAVGILQYGYTYIYDEPPYDEGLNEKISATYKDMHSRNPHIRNMLTTAPRPEISDCDIWCGIWASYGCDEFIIRDYQQKGDTVWWYGCVGPQAPYPTYHIMDNLMTSRLVHWMQKDFNVTGNLYWAAGHSESFDLDKNETRGFRDIWNDPYVFRYGDGSVGGAAGDGFLYYVGIKGDGVVNETRPVPTMRLESIRDGCEDYEYLLLLENKIKALFEKWKITDVSVDEYMDTYYDSLYNSMGDYNHRPELMLEMRQRVAHDILNAESLVMVSSDPTSSCVNRRTVSVFAENGSSVTIDGKEVIGENKGLYSLYEVSFDMLTLPDFTDVEITVNGVSYKRTLKTVTDAEYMFDAKLKIEKNAKALGLENYSEIRDLFAKNTFVTFLAPSLGNLEEQLQSGGKGEAAVEIINKDPRVRGEVLKALVKEAENTIPVAVMNEAAVNGPYNQEKLSIYVPRGAEVTVNGKKASFIRSEAKASLYEATVDTADKYRSSYELSVTFEGKTETWTKFIVNEYSAFVSAVDFSDPAFIEKMNAFPKNQGLSFELVEYEGAPALKVTFKTEDDRITLNGNVLSLTDFSGYKDLYLDLVNLQPSRTEGVDLTVSTGRSNFNLDFKKTPTAFDGLLKVTLPSGNLKKISRLTLVSGGVNSDKKIVNESYIVKGIYLVNYKEKDS